MKTESAELARDREEFFSIYDRLPREDQRTMNSYLRHLAGEQLPPDELEKLRKVCRNAGMNPAEYSL